jgi:hypothetical protein
MPAPGCSNEWQAAKIPASELFRKMFGATWLEKTHSNRNRPGVILLGCVGGELNFIERFS